MDLAGWSSKTSRTADFGVKMLRISEGIVKGLAHINNLDIIHNDLKPENVFVDKFDKPFIGDFGVATNRGEPLVGWTRRFFDKESLALIPDEKSDSWLLGATLWEFWSHKLFDVDREVSMDRIDNVKIIGILKELLRPRASRSTAGQILDYFESDTKLSQQASPAKQYWEALATGNTSKLRSILAESLVKVDSIKDGLSGFQFACRKNLPDVVNILLEFGSNHERRDESGNQPIQLSTSVEVWRAISTKLPAPTCDLFEAAKTGDDVGARLILAAESAG
ncbi:hypothetical protein HDU96_003367 [Phlyctochytrium bullatum]|nr:hypothetical protein HDU96_003367 [Phlyctochytrium bullatum]